MNGYAPFIAAHKVHVWPTSNNVARTTLIGARNETERSIVTSKRYGVNTFGTRSTLNHRRISLVRGITGKAMAKRHDTVCGISFVGASLTSKAKTLINHYAWQKTSIFTFT
jgi:hypothetical protein